MPGTVPEDLDVTAAVMTAAMLRFDIERLPRNPIALPYDQPGALGEAAFVLFPEQQLVPTSDFANHLAALPKPVMLAALAHKGFIAAWWRDGLSGRALAAWDHNAANLQASLHSQLAERGVGDADLVLLETTEERFYVSGAALRRWVACYRVDILWNLIPLEGDHRSATRLLLCRGDGRRSPGSSCGLRQ